MKSDIKTITKEPWVDLKIKKTRHNSIQYNQTLRQREKYKFFQIAYDFLLANNIKGSYFEFGCHRARNFFAFDSFKGLPKDKNYKKQNEYFFSGNLNTNKKEFLNLVSKYKKYRSISIIDGYYKNTLSNKLINEFKKDKTKTSFINIDCDLEQSVSESLNFSTKFIVDGTILYIDDYYNVYKGDPRKGNPKVVINILKKNKIFYEPWHVVGTCGKSFLLYK